MRIKRGEMWIFRASSLTRRIKREPHVNSECVNSTARVSIKRKYK